MRIEKLPFTVYDIVGYLAPGFFFSWHIAYIVKNTYGHNINRLYVFGDNVYNEASLAIIFIIISYISGHIISLLSSMTIEKLSYAYFGYPSQYLIDECKFNGPYKERLISKKIAEANNFKRIIVLKTLCLPLVIFIFMMHITSLFGVLIKSLPDKTVDMLKAKFLLVSTYNMIPKKADNWFRYIDFYVRNNCEVANYRMYNYVTIFGFCRSMSFVMLMFFWILFIDAILTKNGVMLMVSFIASVSSFLLFLGFIKYFRRYSEEVIMAFITEKNERRDKDFV